MGGRRRQEAVDDTAKRGTLAVLGLGLSLSLAACTMYQDLQAMKSARYEVADHKGAAFCGGCHPDHFSQWRENSRHFIATSGETFLVMKEKFKHDLLLNTMMGESMCYGCHGPKDGNEGVNCETCHGAAATFSDVQEMHRMKFAPLMSELRKPDFCAKCHEMTNPMSGAVMLSVYSEWVKSPAASEGKRCQDCHMQKLEYGGRYHGFDTARRNVAIYRNDLHLADFKLDFPRLKMVLENRVTGHAIPASCATRLLVLQIDFYGQGGEVVHVITTAFAKRVTLMRSLMPYEIVENTQLQAGERRPLAFILPEALKGKLHSIVVTLKFYEVPEEYLGDMGKASWISEPVVRKEYRIVEKDSAMTMLEET